MIQITPTAAQEIRRIQRSRNAPDSFLRLSVAKGGCLDFIYQFDLETEPQEGDRQYSSHNIKILVNAADDETLQERRMEVTPATVGV